MRSIVVGLAALSLVPAVLAANAPATRRFHFTYEATVEKIPENAKRVSIWIPYPASDAYQRISTVKITTPYSTTVKKDALGNRVLHVEVDEVRYDSIPVSVEFDVERREHVRREPVHDAKPDSGAKSLETFLKPDRLVPLDDRIRKLAAEVTAAKSSPLDKAKAIYDYVLANMTYDKSGTGWGNGDIRWACDAKRGNCTDFHALFIGLARASGIPARFSIGFPLPAARGEGEIPGYHCWAEFWVDGYGWIPVDASEASKHPDKKDYFFGAHDENRVQLSTGRDLVLEPKQAAAPLNYFVYPYVEIDGKPYADVTKKFRYRDVESPPRG